jgi:hypothetical protein
LRSQPEHSLSSAHTCKRLPSCTHVLSNLLHLQTCYGLYKHTSPSQHTWCVDTLIMATLLAMRPVLLKSQRLGGGQLTASVNLFTLSAGSSGLKVGSQKFHTVPKTRAGTQAALADEHQSHSIFPDPTVNNLAVHTSGRPQYWQKILRWQHVPESQFLNHEWQVCVALHTPLRLDLTYTDRQHHRQAE